MEKAEKKMIKQRDTEDEEDTEVFKGELKPKEQAFILKMTIKKQPVGPER